MKVLRDNASLIVRLACGDQSLVCLFALPPVIRSPPRALHCTALDPPKVHDMRLVQAVLILSALLAFLVDAAATPSEDRKRNNGNAREKERRLEPRARKPSPRPRQEKVKRDEEEGMDKYFHEPGGSELGNHYDSRYHHGIQEYADRKDTQLHMVRAYVTFCNENRLETWLAHGTLLGWWWNGKMLPWDWDIDTQVSGSTLAYMAKHHNYTHYDYVSKDDPPVERTYLLDVNPASIERERGNGNNIIDARWIDTRNGLYIDITGLSETHPDDQPGVWSCKNYHRYHTADLYPMRETMYEGIIAKVPYAYDRILTQEYEENALVLADYEGHRWDPVVKMWLQKPEEELAEERKEKEAKEKEEEARKAE
ncbi:MAG: hypothetical protein L6R35_004405 [Caloplaca aegaea]|nr:MAG: hypothetical protein L6R35_004405 [Caloplaca aegaea]